MGSLNRPRGISPHVKVYDSKSLSMMIAADKASPASGSGNATWGSMIRRIPAESTHPIYLTSHTSAATAASDMSAENHIISDFGTYVRHKFGDKVTTTQSVALSWFHARCKQHHHQLMLSLQQDTIVLAGKLFSSPPASMPRVPPQPTPCSGEARQAHSEPSRAPMYGKTIQNNKRGAESTHAFYKRRGTKKQYLPPTRYALPETLLSGMSVSDEHEAADERSDIEYHSRPTRLETPLCVTSPRCNIDVPSFDLGVELDTEAGKEPHDSRTNNDDVQIPGYNIEVPSLDLGAELGTASGKEPHGPRTNNDDVQIPVEHQSSFDCGSPNVSLGLAGPSPCPKTRTVSVNDPPDNSISFEDDNCVQFSTPMKLLNAISGTPPSANNIRSPIFSTPDQRIKSSTSPGTLSKILAEGDLVERMTRSEDSPNINIKPWENEYTDSPILKRTVGTPKMAKSPWTYNLYHRNPPTDVVDKFFHDVSLSSYSILNRPWLAHTCPRHIELDGTWIHKAFLKESPLSYDIFDLAIRRLKQLDDMMYLDSSDAHWRHILESEFAIFALADEAPYNRKSIVEQFIGSSVRYRLEDCRMIVVPAFILLNWSCYFFDFKYKCVHVIDPLYKKDQSEIFEKMHHPNISKVAASLANCFEMFFGNWHHTMHNWDVVYFEPSILDASSWESGLLTLMHIRQFDGSKINFVNRETFGYYKKVMLYELMCLSNNHVKPPVSMTITIDD